VRSRGIVVIRQAISCDICGTEKKQTNHWFVANDQGTELRISGWNSRNRLRPGSKHLCGQTCLHKLVDDFTARALAVRPQPVTAEEGEASKPAVGVDASLTSKAAYIGVDASAHILTPPAPVAFPRPPLRALPELVAMPPRRQADEPAAPLPDEPHDYSSRNWRAEAWDRERAREMKAVERRPDRNTLRRSAL
jgi:hypothetical protein